MNAKHHVCVQGFLALAALIFALWTRASVPSPTNAETTFYSCSSLREVRYEDAERAVRILRDKDKIWVEIEDSSEGEASIHRFPGGERAADLFDELRSLGARRTIRDPESSFLSSIGLGQTDVSPKLSIQCDTETTEIEIGHSVFGTAQRYIRKKGQQNIILVHSGAIHSLENANLLLMERRLHRFSMRDAASVTLTFQNSTRTFSHQNRRKYNASWVDPRTPQQRRRDIDRLMRALKQITIQDYRHFLSPQGDVFRVDYFKSNDERLGFMELIRQGEGASTVFAARSEETEVWVRINASSGAAVLRAWEFHRSRVGVR